MQSLTENQRKTLEKELNGVNYAIDNVVFEEGGVPHARARENLKKYANSLYETLIDTANGAESSGLGQKMSIAEVIEQTKKKSEACYAQWYNGINGIPSKKESLERANLREKSEMLDDKVKMLETFQKMLLQMGIEPLMCNIPFLFDKPPMECDRGSYMKVYIAGYRLKNHTCKFMTYYKFRTQEEAQKYIDMYSGTSQYEYKLIEKDIKFPQYWNGRY